MKYDCENPYPVQNLVKAAHYMGYENKGQLLINIFQWIESGVNQQALYIALDKIVEKGDQKYKGLEKIVDYVIEKRESRYRW